MSAAAKPYTGEEVEAFRRTVEANRHTDGTVMTRYEETARWLATVDARDAATKALHDLASAVAAAWQARINSSTVEIGRLRSELEKAKSHRCVQPQVVFMDEALNMGDGSYRP